MQLDSPRSGKKFLSGGPGPVFFYRWLPLCSCSFQLRGPLIASLVLQFLILNSYLCHEDPLLEKATSQMDVVLVHISPIEVEDIELPGCHMPHTICMLGFWITAIRPIGEQD